MELIGIGKVDTQRAIGGIQTSSVFTGCKSVMGTPEAWYRYGKFVASGGTALASVINPFALVGKAITLPLLTIKSLLQFRTTLPALADSTKDSYFSAAYHYSIPGTQVKFEPNQLSETVGKVTEALEKGCGDL